MDLHESRRLEHCPGHAAGTYGVLHLPLVSHERIVRRHAWTHRDVDELCDAGLLRRLDEGKLAVTVNAVQRVAAAAGCHCVGRRDDTSSAATCGFEAAAILEVPVDDVGAEVAQDRLFRRAAPHERPNRPALLDGDGDRLPCPAGPWNRPPVSRGRLLACPQPAARARSRNVRASSGLPSVAAARARSRQDIVSSQRGTQLKLSSEFRR